jgi:hypothetical protein
LDTYLGERNITSSQNPKKINKQKKVSIIPMISQNLKQMSSSTTSTAFSKQLNTQKVITSATTIPSNKQNSTKELDRALQATSSLKIPISKIKTEATINYEEKPSKVKSPRNTLKVKRLNGKFKLSPQKKIKE